MRLEEYLEEKKIPKVEFRKKMGIKSKTTLYRYFSGERYPTPKIMKKIIELTNGEVQPMDFFQEDQEME